MTHGTNRRQLYIVVASLLFLLFVGIAIWLSNTSPAPAEVVAPQTEAAPTVEPTRTPHSPDYWITDQQTFVHPKGIYTLTLPGPWSLIQMAEAGEAEPGQEDARPAVADATWIMDDPVSSAQGKTPVISVSSAPRDHLYLETYIVALTAELATDPAISVASAAIVDDLREQAVPVAAITMTSRAEQTVIYQIAMFDERAENLVTLSLAADPELFGELAAEVNVWVAAVEFPD